MSSCCHPRSCGWAAGEESAQKQSCYHTRPHGQKRCHPGPCGLGRRGITPTNGLGGALGLCRLSRKGLRRPHGCCPAHQSDGSSKLMEAGTPGRGNLRGPQTARSDHSGRQSVADHRGRATNKHLCRAKPMRCARASRSHVQ